MKNIITIIIFLVFGFSSFSVVAQNKHYEESMKKNLSILESAKTVAEFEKAASGFETIALFEKKDWLPYYYAGICNSLVAFEKKGKEIDIWCNKADVQAKKADSLSNNNSEVSVLKSMISAARIFVDQKKRSQKYGSQSAKFVVDAIKLDVNNPRAYLQKARVLLNTPDALGGGNKKAKQALELALEKYKTFKPVSNLHPNWGKTDAEKELKKVNEKLKK